jgi:hypothetical protein
MGRRRRKKEKKPDGDSALHGLVHDDGILHKVARERRGRHFTRHEVAARRRANRDYGVLLESCVELCCVVLGALRHTNPKPNKKQAQLDCRHIKANLTRNCSESRGNTAASNRVVRQTQSNEIPSQPKSVAAQQKSCQPHSLTTSARASCAMPILICATESTLSQHATTSWFSS